MPQETRAIDIRKLRDAQKADFKGNKIPANASDGDLVWSKMDSVPVVGRLLVLHRGKGLASNFDCQCTFKCPKGFVAISESPTSASAVPGGTTQFTCMETWRDCNGFDLFFDVTGSAGWTSSNTAVATVNDTTLKGLAAGVAGGSATITATFTDSTFVWSVAEQMCKESFVTMSAGATCDVQVLGSFRITVTSSPVSGETNSLVSGQSANVKVEALTTTGSVMTLYRGTVHFSSGDAAATLPGNYTFTAADNGAHTFSVTLKTVAGTSATRDLSVEDTVKGAKSTQNINLWFKVSAAIQFYENCDGFTTGSYHNQTACNPNGLAQNSVFVSLPDSGQVPCATSIRIRNQADGTLVQTTTQERGPGPLGRLWWNTGNVPTDLSSMCVSDGVALALGQTFVNGGAPGTNRFGCPNPIPNNPPNSAFGQGNIYLRFGP